MYTRRWKATWRDQSGHLQEYIFSAPDSRVIARVDFQIKLMDQGRPVPNLFDLEEGKIVVGVVPSIKELEERGQI